MSRRLVCIDLETHLIKPGMLAPRMVCLSWADGEGAGLLDRFDGIAFVRRMLKDREVILVGHNIQFDLGVLCVEAPDLLPLVFAALDEGRVSDTMYRQKLLDIARGESEFRRNHEGKRVKAHYTLAALVELYTGEKLIKKGGPRLGYGDLDGTPIADWPEPAKVYALKDADRPLVVWAMQDAQIETDPEILAPAMLCEAETMRGAWALHLMGMWGVRTDGPRVAKLRTKLEAERDKGIAALKEAGILRPDGTKDMKKLRARILECFAARGEEPPKTDTGEIATGEDVLRATGDELLTRYAESVGAIKVLTTYVPALERGINHPCCARFNPVVDSFRSSCSDPNWQNPPRDGDVRPCVVARAGMVFIGADYDTVELRALGQVQLTLFGRSKFAEAFQRDEDPHVSFAAELLGVAVAEAIRRNADGDSVVKERRQFAKIFNYGKPGGLGDDSFVEYAAANGVTVSSEDSKRYGRAWRAAWEMEEFFDHVDKTARLDGVIIHPLTGFVRGGLRYTSAANHFFQHPVAWGAKRALYVVAKECYLDAASALFGSRPVLFIHDEIMCESPERKASAAALRLAEVMRVEMQAVIKDVPIKCSPVITRRWLKGAKPTRNAAGDLIPTEEKLAA